MIPESQRPLTEPLLERLCQSSHVCVLTGAGMSAESGIPTFRDAQTGLWSKYRPEELATPEAFSANPKRVWSWYQERREGVRTASPHGGHFALAELQTLLTRVTIVTQNVDGLHQRAGAVGVIELHGNIMRTVCDVTAKPISEEWLARSHQSPPRSPWVEGGLARPDVVWFGEPLPATQMNAALAAAAGCDFCFSIGTTSLVQPAASLPALALESGASLVEINPTQTPLSQHADLCIRGPAEENLESILTQVKRRLGNPDLRARL